MQLDKTRIAIRERSFLDILDLALSVLRQHAGPLALALLAGAVPAALVNHWLLQGLLTESGSEVVWYLFLMALLVYLEMPLATAPVTLYLGQALFVERPSAARLIKDFVTSLPQMVLYQLAPRALFMPLFITIPVPFLGWPYLGEIILLERNPWRKRLPAGTSTLSRSGNMHGRNRGELLTRWLGSVMVGTLLLFVFWRSLWFLAEVLTGQLDDVTPQCTVWLPAALWLVLGYFAIVRFLSYLDLRIRTEGWEIELLLRAEAVRLGRQIS
ncbi:MAG: hypothetical protein B7Z73_11440 [Planctomycetia bacterium 21-64-5]|nr:MAG: hypothetical protein B7Z73_11440 [Planctomycetia bacterium 21-64-5]HQU46154.1 hypothetical protein [Pirellulales bacterium]